MRETVRIPRDELFEFKRQHELTVKKMALYFGVPYPTIEGWLYKKHIHNMSKQLHNMVMEKIVEGNMRLCPSTFHVPEDDMLPLIPSAIKGSTDECWVHYVCEYYSEELHRDNGAKERKMMIEYIRVQKVTFQRWVNLEMPEGLNLLRLRCFLGHRGYRVSELEGLDGPLKALAYLIADGKVTITETVQALRYTATGTLLQVLLGRTGIRDERLDLCRNFVLKKESEEFIQAETHQEETLVDDIAAKQIEEVPISIQTPREQIKHDLSLVGRVNGARTWVIENLAALVRIMIPLAEEVLSDAYPEKERERLRTLVNGDGVFRLSNALNGLCGPRMRAHMLNQHGEE